MLEAETKMNLEIRHLKLIAAIADTGSMTRAGNRLHLTQSALSHQLRDAEETLGTRLFARQKGTMALTAAGERLLRSARAAWTSWIARKKKFATPAEMWVRTAG
jgi:DNA-binding transcriptional LysR family regulator